MGADRYESTFGKVKYYAAQFFYDIPFLPTWCHDYALSIIDTKRGVKDQFQQELLKNRLDAIKGNLPENPPLKPVWASKLYQKIKNFDPKTVTPDDIRQVRKELNEITKSPYYQNNKYAESPFINFVNALVHAFRHEAKGCQAMANLGSKFTDQADTIYSMEDLASKIEEGVGNNRGFTVGNKLLKLLKWFAHPGRSFLSLFGHGHFGKDPVADYTAYDFNDDWRGGTYKIGNAEIQFTHGPTGTSDNLFLTDVQVHPEDTFIYHDLQHPKVKGEDARIKKLNELEETNDNMMLFRTPMDDASWKEKKGFDQWQYRNSDEFFDELLRFKRDNPSDVSGFYLGKTFTDREFEMAVYAAKAAFGNMEIDPKDKVRVGRALQVALHGFLSVGAMVKISNEAAGNIYLHQACKQDIDRGVVANVMTQALFQMLAGKEFSQDDVNRIVGMVIGRADYVEEREIINNRVQGLIDALNVISQNEKDFKFYLNIFLHYCNGGHDQLGEFDFVAN